MHRSIAGICKERVGVREAGAMAYLIRRSHGGRRHLVGGGGGNNVGETK